MELENKHKPKLAKRYKHTNNQIYTKQTRNKTAKAAKKSTILQTSKP